MIIRKFNTKKSIPSDIYKKLKRLEREYHTDDSSYILFNKNNAKLTKNEKLYTFQTDKLELIGYYSIDNSKKISKILEDEEYDDDFDFYNEAIKFAKNKKISLINDLIINQNKRIYIRQIISHILSNNTKYIYGSCNVFSLNLCKKSKKLGLIDDYIIESECDDYYEYIEEGECDDSIGVLIKK